MQYTVNLTVINCKKLDRFTVDFYSSWGQIGCPYFTVIIFYSVQWLQTCFSWTLPFSLFQLSLPSLCLSLLFLTHGFWPQSPAAENWWVAHYPLHSPYGRHVRLQAWLDKHNSLNGIFCNVVISICSLNMLKFVCALYW